MNIFSAHYLLLVACGGEVSYEKGRSRRRGRSVIDTEAVGLCLLNDHVIERFFVS